MNSACFGSVRIPAIAVALLLGLVTAMPAVANEIWVRIDHPDATLRAQLPAEAMDYGGFVWMPERLVPAAARSHQRLHRSEQPFAMPVDGQPVDLAEMPIGVGRSSGDADAARFQLIQFRGPARRAWLNELKAKGLAPVQFIAPNTYLVWGRAEQLPPAGLSSADPVRFAGSLPSSIGRQGLQ